MKKRLVVLALVLMGAVVRSQNGVAGDWRAASVVPDGTADGAIRELGLSVKTDGTTVTAAVTGAPVVIREGRVQDRTMTLTGVNTADNQPVSFTGTLDGDEIVFRVVGVTAQPLHFVARRITPSAELTGSVSDAALVARLMQQYKVPGVSIAIIKDFKVVLALAYGVADAQTGAPVSPRTMFQAASVSKPVAAMVSLKAVQQGRFTLDQDVNTILKTWKLPGGALTASGPVTPRMLMSHTSGTGDAFGFPGYAPGAPLPSVSQILDGTAPANLRAVRLERAPFAGYEYSGGGVMVQQLALTDAIGSPFARIAREWVLDPAGMTDSTFEQPLPQARHAQAARAHDREGARMNEPWRVHPEQAAAGLWTTPTDLAKFAIELQLAVQGRSSRVLPAPLAREMITPVGVGPYAVGFGILKQGEGWYFSHSGSNWGFQCDLTAHVSKGYGAVIMTNSDSGGALIPQLLRLIQREYGWDALDAPIPRRYGPQT